MKLVHGDKIKVLAWSEFHEPMVELITTERYMNQTHNFFLTPKQAAKLAKKLVEAASDERRERKKRL